LQGWKRRRTWDGPFQTLRSTEKEKWVDSPRGGFKDKWFACWEEPGVKTVVFADGEKKGETMGSGTSAQESGTAPTKTPPVSGVEVRGG